MSKKTPLSDADKALFKEAMKNVTPLIHNKISSTRTLTLPFKPRPAPHVKKKEAFVLSFSDYDTLESVASDDIIEFFRPGLQHKILRKMRTGQYNIEARLDLHGMTVARAREALSRFIIDCNRKGIRYVLIIHGKGRPHTHPVLKNKLNHWLRQINPILAFCSANVKHGSNGALYVLFRGSPP